MEQRYEQLWRAALGAAVSAGANVSHHHGVGLLKARALQDSLGEGRHALAALKRRVRSRRHHEPGEARPVRSPFTLSEVEGCRLRPQLTPASQARHAERRGVHALRRPADERALAEVLQVLKDRGARLRPRAAPVPRRGSRGIGTIEARSMTVRGAGRRDARGLGAGAAPEEPDARRAAARRRGRETLADFLEGPHAGLRAIPGGRLEPLCARLEGMTSDGRVFVTQPGPRSAAGPDLTALFLGGRRGAWAWSPRRWCARTEPPRTTARRPSASTRRGRRRWRSGAWCRDGACSRARRSAGRPRGCSSSCSWAGSEGQVERDRELIERVFGDVGGKAARELTLTPFAGDEQDAHLGRRGDGRSRPTPPSSCTAWRCPEWWRAARRPVPAPSTWQTCARGGRGPRSLERTWRHSRERDGSARPGVHDLHLLPEGVPVRVPGGRGLGERGPLHLGEDDRRAPGGDRPAPDGRRALEGGARLRRLRPLHDVLQAREHGRAGAVRARARPRCTRARSRAARPRRSPPSSRGEPLRRASWAPLVERLRTDTPMRHALFTGCSALVKQPGTIEDVLAVSAAFGAPMGVARASAKCCGYPLYAAGAMSPFREHAQGGGGGVGVVARAGGARSRLRLHLQGRLPEGGRAPADAASAR